MYFVCDCGCWWRLYFLLYRSFQYDQHLPCSSDRTVMDNIYLPCPAWTAQYISGKQGEKAKHIRMYFISGLFYQISTHGIISLIVNSFLPAKSSTSLQLAEQPHSLLELHLAQPGAGLGITGTRRGRRRKGWAAHGTTKLRGHGGLQGKEGEKKARVNCTRNNSAGLGIIRTMRERTRQGWVAPWTTFYRGNI